MTEEISNSNSNSNYPNKEKKWKIIIKNIFFFIACLIALSISIFYLIKNVKHYLKPLSTDIIPDYISILPIIAGGLFIALWYIYRGKSVKSLNDAILFASASYALYLFLFDYEFYKSFTDLQYIAEHLYQIGIKVLILISTVGKTLITIVEFINDRHKENQVIKQKKLNAEPKNDGPSASDMNNTPSNTAIPDLITHNNFYYKLVLFVAIGMTSAPWVFIYLRDYI